MAWHLGLAVGGVKLQVDDDDAERALAVLNSDTPTTITESDWQTDESLAENNFEDDDENEEQVQSPVDEQLDRAYRAAIFGLIFFPLSFYALHVFMDANNDRTEPLSSKAKWQNIITVALCVPAIIFGLIILWYLFIPSFSFSR